MQHLFTPEGEAALAALLALRPLLAFDFDGTLAPIVAQPDDALIARPVATRLRALSARLPVAIVTGRSVADVRPRLGFEPRFVVGNHGAEDGSVGADAAASGGAIEGVRERLREHAEALRRAGVAVEDKGLSVALHYRLARDREAARDAIALALTPEPAGVHVYPGKMVVNAVAAGAPDKSHAVHALVARCGAQAALFAGDDVNDEPVFASAPPHWLTLRVGSADPGCRARFRIDGPQEMAMLLDRALAITAASPGR